MSNFLSVSCDFKGPDLVWIKNEASPAKIYSEITQLENEAKKAAKDSNNKKLLIFVYYSGHGTLDHSGSTHGHTLDGTSFDIESLVRKLSAWPNTAVISILDCCRLEQKGFKKSYTQSSWPISTHSFHTTWQNCSWWKGWKVFCCNTRFSYCNEEYLVNFSSIHSRLGKNSQTGTGNR